MNSAIEIKSIGELISWNNENTKGDTRRFVFRGVTNTNYQLIPKIARTGNSFDPVSKQVAKKRLDKLKEYLDVHLPSYGLDFIGLSDVEKCWRQLFLAQHYGAPTNLLDFTRNPLAALFFSCKNNETDGSIYAVLIQDRSDNINDYNITSLDIIIQARKHPFKGSAISPIFIVPPQMDRRIAAQHSIFCFFPINDSDLPLQEHRISKAVFGQPGFIQKFNVQKEYKGKILDELNKVGLNDSTLFPDLHGFGEFVTWKLFTKYH